MYPMKEEEKEKEKEKSARHTSGDFNQKDWIDELPDEILGMILSRLTMKEAARTCVLCRRWSSLWKFLFTGSLNFDASATMRDIYYRRKDYHTEARKYRDWVNQVLDSHEGICLEELRIAFELGKSYGYCVDKWIDFAIVKRVKKLEIDVTLAAGCYPDSYSEYTFPSWLLDIPFDFPSFDRLTALCLRSVSITEEDLAYFLSTCTLLEELVVENASSLHNFRVSSDQSPKLKLIEVRYCQKLENIEVSSESVVSFKYAGPPINMCFINVPKLSLESLRFNDCCEKFVIKFHTSLYLSRLVRLELDLWRISGKCTSFPKEFPEFSNLKELELKFRANEDDSALFLSSITGASPRLHKLTFKYGIDWWTKSTIALGPEMAKLIQLAEEEEWEKQARNYKHQCLKVIEFIEWIGLKTDVQLANYFLESALSLEKIIIDCPNPSFKPPWIEGPCPTKRAEAALSSAMELEKKLPPGAKLIIS